jgi:hypothetical protein
VGQGIVVSWRSGRSLLKKYVNICNNSFFVAFVTDFLIDFKKERKKK